MPYRWMSYKQARAWEGDAEKEGASKTARSDKGFMREYERAACASAMRTRNLPAGVRGGGTWGQKRAAFVARTLAQYNENPTYRRGLSLIMWAYMPPGFIETYR